VVAIVVDKRGKYKKLAASVGGYYLKTKFSSFKEIAILA
jgi:hypothetical protein